MYVFLIGNENKMGLMSTPKIQLSTVLSKILRATKSNPNWMFLPDVRKRVADARARDTFVTSGIQNAKLKNELLGIITVWGGQKA